MNKDACRHRVCLGHRVAALDIQEAMTQRNTGRAGQSAPAIPNRHQCRRDLTDVEPIDESCLMGLHQMELRHVRESFEQKCKGDPGYPTATA